MTAFQERWQRYEACLIDAKIGPGRRAMVIGTWGTNDLSAYADVIGIVITRLGIRGFPVTEALAGCGFSGILSGLDEHGKGVILEFPEELEKARQAGVNLATGGCPEPVAD